MSLEAPSYLPEIPDVPRGFRKGRAVFDGYQRGWGLRFTPLRDAILADPVYQEAARLAQERSILDEEHRLNLFLIMRFYLSALPFGHIVEFGAYRGGNAIFMAAVAARLHPGMRVYGFDTFRGMPHTDLTIDAHHAGDFDDVDLAELRAYVAGIGLDNLELHQGLFQDVAPQVLREVGPVRLAHIDCDIFSAVAYCYEVVKPSMVDRGYLIFDDATTASCLGATEAVEDIVIRRDGLNSEQIWPHLVFRTPARRPPTVWERLTLHPWRAARAQRRRLAVWCNGDQA